MDIGVKKIAFIILFFMLYMLIGIRFNIDPWGAFYGWVSATVYTTVLDYVP